MQADLFTSLTTPSPPARPPVRLPCPWKPGERFCFLGFWFVVEADGQHASTQRLWDGATLNYCDVCGRALGGSIWVEDRLQWCEHVPAAIGDMWECWERGEIAGPIPNPALLGWLLSNAVVGHAGCLNVPLEMR